MIITPYESKVCNDKLNALCNGKALLLLNDTKNVKMTLSLVKNLLAQVNITICRTGYGEELKVRIKGSEAGHGYFTTDLDDALQTGLHMAKTGNSIQI